MLPLWAAAAPPWATLNCPNQGAPPPLSHSARSGSENTEPTNAKGMSTTTAMERLVARPASLTAVRVIVVVPVWLLDGTTNRNQSVPFGVLDWTGDKLLFGMR